MSLLWSLSHNAKIRGGTIGTVIAEIEAMEVAAVLLEMVVVSITVVIALVVHQEGEEIDMTTTVAGDGIVARRDLMTTVVEVGAADLVVLSTGTTTEASVHLLEEIGEAMKTIAGGIGITVMQGVHAVMIETIVTTGTVTIAATSELLQLVL